MSRNSLLGRRSSCRGSLRPRGRIRSAPGSSLVGFGRTLSRIGPSRVGMLARETLVRCGRRRAWSRRFRIRSNSLGLEVRIQPSSNPWIGLSRIEMGFGFRCPSTGRSMDGEHEGRRQRSHIGDLGR